MNLERNRSNQMSIVLFTPSSVDFHRLHKQHLISVAAHDFSEYEFSLRFRLIMSLFTRTFLSKCNAVSNRQFYTQSPLMAKRWKQKTEVYANYSHFLNLGNVIRISLFYNETNDIIKVSSKVYFIFVRREAEQPRWHT